MREQDESGGTVKWQGIDPHETRRENEWLGAGDSYCKISVFRDLGSHDTQTVDEGWKCGVFSQ